MAARGVRLYMLDDTPKSSLVPWLDRTMCTVVAKDAARVGERWSCGESQRSGSLESWFLVEQPSYKRRCCGAELPRAAIKASETRPLSVLAPKQQMRLTYGWYCIRLKTAWVFGRRTLPRVDCKHACGLVVVTEADDHHPASSQARAPV